MTEQPSLENPKHAGATLSPWRHLGAEVHNSSSSTKLAIRQSFHAVREIGANTVLAPVAWDLLEPEEGKFDFTLIDEMIETADALDLHLVPLWFGSWKNGRSSYAPRWVKTDPHRFPRAEIEGARVEHLSPFGGDTRTADAAAFRTLMARIAEKDIHNRVPLVQVQNEVGLLGGARDRSPNAETAWASTIPAQVIEMIKQYTDMPSHHAWVEQGRLACGSWAEVLGSGLDAEEAFMAWAYADYVNAVASAGKSELAVPLFVNAWLDSEIDLVPPPELLAAALDTVEMAGGMKPGDYPSGGPVVRVAPLWRDHAPSIDILAPDIYFGDFDSICSSYHDLSGALLIPEMRRSAQGVAQMFVALFEYHAALVSPFGIDSLKEGELDKERLRDAYRILGVLTRRAAGEATRSRGFSLDATTPRAEFRFDDYVLTVDSVDPFRHLETDYPAYGAIVDLGDGAFVAAGRGFTLSFARVDGRPVSVLSASEIDEDSDGHVGVTRHLSGDETASGSSVWFPHLNGESPTWFPIPGHPLQSGVLRFELYSY